MATDKQDVKEIDLLELFSLIGKGIRKGIESILKSLLFLFVFGIKKAHWLALAVVIGGLVGHIFFSNTQRYYSSNLIGQPNGITAIDMVQYINDLNQFSKKGNTLALVDALDLNDSVAKKIKNIEAFHYLDVNRDEIGDIVDFDHSYNPKDTNIVIDNNRIYVQVEVYNNDAFHSVKSGIFNYVAKNPYLIQLNELRMQELEELVALTNQEITKLDSLQNVDYFKRDANLSANSENRLMFVSENDKQMYYRDKMSLTRQKQKYIKELEMATAPLTIIKDFTPLTMEENPRGGYIIKFSFWFGVVGYLFTLLLNFKSYLIKELELF